MAYLYKSLTYGRNNLVNSCKILNRKGSISLKINNDVPLVFSVVGNGTPRCRPFSSTSITRHSSVDVSSLKGKHFDNLFLLSSDEIKQLLRISHGLKKKLTRNPSCYQPLVSIESFPNGGGRFFYHPAH